MCGTWGWRSRGGGDKGQRHFESVPRHLCWYRHPGYQSHKPSGSRVSEASQDTMRLQLLPAPSLVLAPPPIFIQSTVISKRSFIQQLGPTPLAPYPPSDRTHLLPHLARLASWAQIHKWQSMPNWSPSSCHQDKGRKFHYVTFHKQETVTISP